MALTRRQLSLMIGVLLTIFACPIVYFLWLQDELLQFQVNAINSSATEEEVIARFGTPGTTIGPADRATAKYKFLLWHYTRWDGRELCVVVTIREGIVFARVDGESRSILKRFHESNDNGSPRVIIAPGRVTLMP